MSIGDRRGVLLVVGLVLGMCFEVVHADAAELDAVKRDLASGKAVLLDVREASEWKEGHLRDARPLPLSQIKNGVTAEQLAAAAPPGKIVYLHCAAGARSQTAAQLLRPTGRDLRPLTQGYEELLDVGFPKAAR